MEICFSDAAEWINLGEVSKRNKNITYTVEGRIWVHKPDIKLMLKLQNKHGTGNVNYSPHPFLCYNFREDQVKLYDIFKVDCSNDLFQNIDKVKQANFVLINRDCDKLNHVVLFLLSLSIPFEIIGINVNIFTDHESQIQTHRKYLSWVPYNKPFRSSYCDKLYIRNKPDRVIAYTLSPLDYEHSPWKQIAEVLYKTSTIGGIHFELNVIDSIEQELVFLHPWFGLIETDEEEKIKDFLQVFQTHVNIVFCHKLFVLSQRTKNLINECGINIDIVVINLPEIDEKSIIINDEELIMSIKNEINTPDILSLFGLIE